MSRSPLFYPLNRGMDSEAGGAADLQTDVMRFMAILSLCLVAIFALVQSIPLEPVKPERPTPAAETATRPEAPAAPAPPAAVSKPRAVPAPEPQPERRVAAPLQDPVVVQAKAAPAPPPPSTTSEGFTLRFESDFALTRLVAGNDIGLYAIRGDGALRLSITRDTMSFWGASVPREFHEMDAATVPAEVIGALLRAGTGDTDTVKWGVTLPARMARKLETYLRGQPGGSLVIGTDGELSLEQ